MSNIRYLAGQLDMFWRNRSRDFGGFDKPQIVPAATLRRDCPQYFRRYLDQDPNSFYMFVAGDPLKHEDISREKACELFDQFFYEHMRMPSSYDIEAGGEYSREQAIDKEVLPARNDSDYRTFYDEQMDRMRAMEQGEEAPAAEENKDDDVIDVELGTDGTYQSAADRSRSERAVSQAQTTAVGMPRRIWYAVDFHIPAGGGMLGYNRGENRLHGRHSSGFLREEGETDAEFAERQAIAKMAECGLTEEEPVEEGLFGGSKIPSVSEEYDNVKQVKDVISKIKDRFGKIAVVKMGCDRILSDIVANDDDALEFGKACFGLLVGIADNMDKLDEGATEECEKCGDPACKDGEICGLKEEEKNLDEKKVEGIDNAIKALDDVKKVDEEIKLEKDAAGRTVIAEEKQVEECDASLDEFEPEEDGSEYYGTVMEKVEAIVDDEVCEEDDVDECDIAEMIELGKKIR